MVSVVLPVYNEEEVLPQLRERLEPVLASLGQETEVVFIDDGSGDRSPEILARWTEDWPGSVLVRLSRNFGHQAACTVGLRKATGDAVILMDADLQDPPETIPEMVELWKTGSEVVVGERRGRKERGLRRWAFDAFYVVFNVLSDAPIGLKSGVFCLMDRKVVDELADLPERNRFLPGLRWYVGFNVDKVEYDRDERAAGASKQSSSRLIRYALDAILSFSPKPLRLLSLIGLLVCFLSSSYALVLVVQRILGINVVRGFTTPTVAILFLGGLNLLGLGIVGEYIARIYDEVKARPIAIVRDEIRSAGAGSGNGSGDGDQA